MRKTFAFTLAALLFGFAVPAQAQSSHVQSTPGNAGAAEVTVDRDVGAALPGPVAPRPTPKFDSVGRGPLDLDPDAGLKSLGTVTLNRDGSVSSAPASDQLRDIFLEEKAQPGSTGGDVAADRAIGATDDRLAVGDATSYPARAVGWLWVQDQKGGWGTCSAALIGPRTVITAAHCVYDHDTGGWVTQISFYPGANAPDTEPYGSYDWDSANILQGFIDNYDGANYGSVLPWDLAVITLQDSAGDKLGWLGFEVDEATDFNAEILGYPGDKPDGTMWESDCEIPAANFADLYVWHTCDTYSGSSGSSMFETDATSGNVYVRSINVAEDEEVNYAVRLTKTYYDWVLANYK